MGARWTTTAGWCIAVLAFLWMLGALLRFYVPQEILLLVSWLASLAAPLLWLSILVACVVSKLHRRDVAMLAATAALIVLAITSTPWIQRLGAHAFLATRREELTALVEQLAAQRETRSEAGPWIVAASSLRESGFILAEVTTRYTALAHDGFQGAYGGLLHHAPGPRSISEGDFLFSNEIVVLEPLDPDASWSLFTTR